MCGTCQHIRYFLLGSLLSTLASEPDPLADLSLLPPVHTINLLCKCYPILIPVCLPPHQYLETHSIWDPQWPHLAKELEYFLRVTHSPHTSIPKTQRGQQKPRNREAPNKDRARHQNFHHKHHKPRDLDKSSRAQSITPKTICLHQNPAALPQQALQYVI